MSKDNQDSQETKKTDSENTPEETKEQNTEEETSTQTPEENKEESTEQDAEKNTSEEKPIPAPGESYDEGGNATDENSFGDKKMKFGYIALAILVAVILFFGAKNKILEYFSGEHRTKAPVVSESKNKGSIFPSTPAIEKSGEEQSMPVGESKAEINSEKQQPSINQAATMTEDDVKKTVKNFILNNPDIVMEALIKYEKKANEQKAQETKEYLTKNSAEISQNRPFLGNKDGTLSMVEFFDYRCGHCNKAHLELVKLMQTYPNLKITLIPLPFMGDDSAKAVKFSLAVNKLYPDKFANFHADLINAAAINDFFISKLIAKYGLDKTKLTAETNSDEINNLIKEDVQLAQKVGVQGVPSFIINGEIIPGAASYEEFKNKIDAMINAPK